MHSIGQRQTEKKTEEQVVPQNLHWLSGECYSRLPWPTHWNKVASISIRWRSLLPPVGMCKAQEQRMNSLES